MEQFQYTVNKLMIKYSECPHCFESTGKIVKKFRSITIVNDCPHCKGEGRIPHRIIQEVPLTKEILLELNII